MFLRKQSRKDFSQFIKAAKVETELLKETNKFLKNATNLNPLMKWYKRKFWYVSPKWLLLDAEMRQVNIQIDQDWIHIQWYWTDWVTYDELAFFDKDEARDMAQLVAGTYIKDLEHDKAFYEDMLKRTDDAIAYAKLPPEDKKNAQLPASDTMTVVDPIEWTDLAWHTEVPVQENESQVLSPNTKTTWKKQKRQSKKKTQ